MRQINILFLDTAEPFSIHDRLNAQYLLSLSETAGLQIYCNVPENQDSSVANLNCERIIRIPFNINSKFDLKAIKKISDLSSKLDIDIIHCHSSRAHSVAILSKYFSKSACKIISRRGIIRPIHRFDPSEYITYLNKNLTHIIAISNAISNSLLSSGFSPEDITVIYPALEEKTSQHHNNIKPTKAEIKKNNSISDKSLIVGCIANARHVKGLDILAKAINNLVDDLPIEFIIIGDGCDSYMRQLLSHKALESTHFTGYVPCVDTYLSLCDIYVQPSRMEGLSLALAEALSLGVACIASNVGGMDEMIENHKNGLKFQNGDYIDLESKIRLLLKDSNLRNRISKCGKVFSENNFSQRSMTQKTINLYKAILKN